MNIFLNNFIDLLLESMPFIILGLIISGLIKGFISNLWLAKQLGGSGFWNIVKASLIGAPLPLCSCGVIPTALTIRRAGASRGAMTAFLVSTPETGVDSVGMTYGMMGGFMAVIRPVAAIVSAIMAGSATEFLMRNTPDTTSNEQATNNLPNGFWAKVVYGSNYVLKKIIFDTGKWVFMGLALAALIKTFVPPELLSSYGSGFYAMFAMAIVGIPLYVCASASTPLAVSFLALGISPGAVLVFMLVGPATNISTMMMLKYELGYRALISYILSITLVAFGFGYLTDFLVNNYGFIVSSNRLPHGVMSYIIEWGSLIIFTILYIRSMFLMGVFNYNKKDSSNNSNNSCSQK